MVKSEGENVLSDSLRFSLAGEIALAAYYVKANWPRSINAPAIDTSSAPMTIVFAFDAQTVRDLQETLSSAISLNGRMAQSARTMRMLLETRLKGRVIPDLSNQSGSRAG